MPLPDINLRRLFLYLLIGSVSLSALIGIGVLLFGDFGNFEVRVMMTTLTVTVTSILGLACGAYLETGRGRSMPIAGIAFSIAAALMTFLIIWNVYDGNENFIKATATATLLALSCSHISLLSLARLDHRFRWSRILASVSVGLLSAILLYIMWFEPEGDSDIIFRVIGILSILIAAATVITPVFHKLSRTNETTEIDSLDRQIADLKEQLATLEDERDRLAGDFEKTS